MATTTQHNQKCITDIIGRTVIFLIILLTLITSVSAESYYQFEDQYRDLSQERPYIIYDSREAGNYHYSYFSGRFVHRPQSTYGGTTTTSTYSRPISDRYYNHLYRNGNTYSYPRYSDIGKGHNSFGRGYHGRR